MLKLVMCTSTETYIAMSFTLLQEWLKTKQGLSIYIINGDVKLPINTG
jgi:hypothetical protein